MSRSIALACVLVVSALSAQAQTVTTVIPGPSTFDDALSLDADGNLYASYYYGAQVAKITPASAVSTFENGLSNPNGSLVDDAGNLYVAEAGANRVTKITPAGTVEQVGPDLVNPVGLVFDTDGSLLVAQYQISKISRIATDGSRSDFMVGGLLNGPVGLQMDAEGNLYIGNFNDGRILKRTPAGDVSILGDVPGWLGFIALAGDSIYACGFQVNRIYRAPTDGSGMTVFAGTGVAGQANGDVAIARFDGPNGIVATPDGSTLYVTDFNSRALRKISGVDVATSAGDTPIAVRHDAWIAPNPFNPHTSLHYRLEVPARVQLRVLDPRGRLVTTLVDSSLGAGEHSVDFDASGLASGVYLARWEIDGEVLVRKMNLVK